MAEQTPQLPFSIPPYPQMIMEAIEASNDAKGCSKTEIANHIESTQITLPPSHWTLLNYHLIQMQQSGQIAMVKNNYVKPNPNAPKRGRGRPPKSKPQVDLNHVEDPSEPSSEPKRSRGRPRKKPKTESETVKAEEAPTTAQNQPQRRGRGRPPKVKPVMVPVGV